MFFCWKLKVEHLWKKRETILESLLHNKIFGFCQRKKNKLLFSKRFVPNILCPKNKKNFSENFLLQKQVLTRLVYKRKRKTKPFFTKLRLKWQSSAHFVSDKVCPWPKNKTALFCFCLFQICFFFQNEESKKQTNEVRSFFSFCQDNKYGCARQWNIFLFHNCPKSTSLWQLPLVEKKSSSFFLLKKLRSYKKSVIRDL